MIVIAIIGVIASVALPSYNNYVKRAQISEAINFANLAKIHLVDYHIENGIFVPDYEHLSKRNTEIGLEPTSSYRTQYIEDLWVGSGGVRAISATNSAHVAILFKSTLFDPAKRRILFTIAKGPGGRYKMYCRDTGSLWWSGNQVAEKYVPKHCRGVNSASNP